MNNDKPFVGERLAGSTKLSSNSVDNSVSEVTFTLLGDIDKSLRNSEFYQTNPERFVNITLPFKPNLQSKPNSYLFHVPEKEDIYGFTSQIYENMTSHIIIASMNSIFEDTFLSISLMAELLANNKVIILSKERLTILVTREINGEYASGNKKGVKSCLNNEDKRTISLNFFNGIRLTQGNLIVKKTIVTLRDHINPILRDKESEEMYKESIHEKILSILMGFFESYREKHLSPQEIIHEQIKILKYIRQP